MEVYVSGHMGAYECIRMYTDAYWVQVLGAKYPCTHYMLYMHHILHILSMLHILYMPARQCEKVQSG